MVLPKSKKAVGLGKTLIRDRFKHGSRPTKNDTTLHSTDIIDEGPSWTRMQSITQEGDLDEFLRTAELAGTEFTAERLNIRVVAKNTQQNPFLLSADKEEDMLKQHDSFRARLTVPRRPQWDAETTAAELQHRERESFLDWRRDLAQLQETEGLILTPFEKNLEVWRQLWRVVERSDLVVQIVDARHPLFFRSPDLDTYVGEVDPNKKTLLLINKADMLTPRQRTFWADYMDGEGIDYMFFSAAESKKEQQEEHEKEQQLLAEEAELNPTIDPALGGVVERLDGVQVVLDDSDSEEESESEDEDGPTGPTFREREEANVPERIRIRSADELEDLLISKTPALPEGTERKLNIGLVGYPNVGKSSTINALVGAKKVAVGSTPGKTKHFQTIHLSDRVILCDCPGLVFPSFATTQAEMVCNGVLPIDQLREHTGPSALIARRIPKWMVEAIYGIRIVTLPEDEGGTGIPTAEELLCAYAVARGFTKAGQGNPDESRAARHVLKDYVNGKLIFSHPPPGDITEEDFNSDVYDPETFEERFLRRKVVGDARMIHPAAPKRNAPSTRAMASKGGAIDVNFFEGSAAAPRLAGRRVGGGDTFDRANYPHHGVVNDEGVAVPKGKVALSRSLPKAEGKKGHKKGRKNVKQRSGAGYDYNM